MGTASGSEAGAALEIEGLRKGWTTPDGGREEVVDVERFALGAGEQVALRGESGSGKTTLLHMIAGILRPDAGRVRIGGVEMTALDEAGRDRLRAETIGYVFQTFQLLGGYTALENVELGMLFGAGVDPGRARELLRRVGLAERLHHRPGALSVGQQQRVALARALANRPRLVLADEPTGNLDRSRAQSALELVREICREHGAALLLVSHDPLVLGSFERVVELASINRAAAAHAHAPEATA